MVLQFWPLGFHSLVNTAGVFVTKACFAASTPTPKGRPCSSSAGDSWLRCFRCLRLAIQALAQSAGEPSVPVALGPQGLRRRVLGGGTSGDVTCWKCRGPVLGRRRAVLLTAHSSLSAEPSFHLPAPEKFQSRRQGGWGFQELTTHGWGFTPKGGLKLRCQLFRAQGQSARVLISGWLLPPVRPRGRAGEVGGLVKSLQETQVAPCAVGVLPPERGSAGGERVPPATSLAGAWRGVVQGGAVCSKWGAGPSLCLTRELA